METRRDRLHRRLTRPRAPLALGILTVLALVGVVLAIGQGTSHGPGRRVRRGLSGVTVSGRTTRYPSGVPASELAAATLTSSSGPSAPACRTGSSDLAAASSVARRFAARYVAYTLGELGPQPPFPQATGQLTRWVWRQSHTPSPLQAGPGVTVSLAGGWVPRSGVAVVFTRVRIERPGLPAFPMTVAMTFWQCRWLASGL